jgi:hypothetical protein
MEEYKTFCEWEDLECIETSGMYFETSCDSEHEFNIGGLKHNDFKYCPYCGKLIIEVVG